MADPTQSRVVSISGQIGIVFSPLYRSFLQPWLYGQTVPLWPREAASGGEAQRVLRVLPVTR